MAKVMFVDKRNPRRKKWEHFKLQFRRYTYKLSILINIGLSLYIAYEHGKLTTIIERVNPIMEALKSYLPHILG